MTRQIILDTETTGLNARLGDRIIEIGCIEMVNRRFTGNNWHRYINPERKIEEGAKAVHGISDESLLDKPKFADVAAELVEYVRGAELIIHNAAFDVEFLDAEFGRVKMGRLAEHGVTIADTLKMARELHPGKRNSLDALCDRLEVDNSSRTLHGALLDAELLADVYINLTRGQNSLMMDAGTTTQSGMDAPVIDLSQFVLPLLAANDDELDAHEKLLLDIDKASKGKTVWRSATA